jgi:four helix bundle protein
MIRKTVNYKDLIVWQKAIKLAISVFEYTKNYPKEELFGIVSQMRRSAFSIPSNIAEGYCRGGRKEYRQFLQISYASSAELETQLIISLRTKLMSEEKYQQLYDLLLEIMKMLNRMILSLKSPKIL